MFDLAHRLLIEMGDATGIEAYQRLGRNPNKFVHGYGIFQSDLQFFRDEPDFFLEQRWKSFDVCLDKAMKELKGALRQLGFANKTSLTDLESAFVAIVYNTGFRNFKDKQGTATGPLRRDAFLRREYRPLPANRTDNPDADAGRTGGGRGAGR